MARPPGKFVQAILVPDLSPELLADLRQAAVDRLYRAQLCMADMIAESPQRRVSSLLRHLSAHGPTIRLSQSDIGRATGCLRETVSKALSRLERAGAVAVERCAITILDPDLLEV
jgi:CRP-like cAMP-binding protein